MNFIGVFSARPIDIYQLNCLKERFNSIQTDLIYFNESLNEKTTELAKGL